MSCEILNSDRKAQIKMNGERPDSIELQSEKSAEMAQLALENALTNRCGRCIHNNNGYYYCDTVGHIQINGVWPLQSHKPIITGLSGDPSIFGK